MTELYIETELEPGLRNYRLPQVPSQEEAAEAVRQSWRFLRVAPIRITAPLLASAYVAPLSEVITPDFALWLWGGTGSFKSTIAALVLSHFGDFSETRLPLSFESTSNALERSMFLAKDVLTVVDDWRPGVSRKDADAMDEKAQRLLRAAGNRQGRGRMTADTTLRESYPPRGVVVATAEALPEGPTFQSAAARSLSINIGRDDVDLALLSELQRSRGMFSSAMSGYIAFVAAHYQEELSGLPDLQEGLRTRLAPMLSGSHPRTPNYAAALGVGLYEFARYSVDVGAFAEGEAKEKANRAASGVIEAARAHVAATGGADPASEFVDILRSLLNSGQVHFTDRRSGEVPVGAERLGWLGSSVGDEVYREKRGNPIGWADEVYLYLEPNLAYATVSRFAQTGGIPFGIKPKALWNTFAKTGKSLTDEGRNTATAKIEGKTKRVIQLPRSVVLEAEG